MCCEKLEEYINTMKDKSFSVGSGEISGNIEACETTEYGFDIRFADGWNWFPTLKVQYCPFCGEKLSKSHSIDETKLDIHDFLKDTY